MSVLITGASSGIGLELARAAARDGKDLILVARSEGKLRALAQELQQAHGVQVAVVAADLGAPGAAQALYQEVTARGLQVDALINNAGYGLNGSFLAVDAADQSAMIGLNVLALTELTRQFLPDMVQRGHGRVLNVASTAAFMPGPHMAVYYATKAYVLSFTEAIAQELNGTGVTATALCPGPTPSGFQERASLKLSLMMRAMLTEADHVAQTGYNAMKRGQTVVIPGLMNRITTFSLRLLPRFVIRRMAAMANSAH